MTGLHVYGEGLSAQRMADITSCSGARGTGDVINWSTAEWTLGRDYEEVSHSVYCVNQPTWSVVSFSLYAGVYGIIPTVLVVMVR